MPVVECEGLVRIFRTADVEVQALQGLDLRLDDGELVAVVGASGSGKSTMLTILSGLDVPTAGRVVVAGHDLTALHGRARVHYQRHVVGFLWQQTSRNLLPYLSAADNVALPLAVTRTAAAARRARVEELLALLGVAHCRDRLPHEMSGGEQQRVALGVALANSPQVLLADEPTGELDGDAEDRVLRHLRRRALAGTAVVLVTHSPHVLAFADRVVRLHDGRVVDDGRVDDDRVDDDGRGDDAHASLGAAS